jgi:acetyl-CoA C-acetyltransferase
MPDAMIVSTTRTPIGRAYKGVSNAAHAIKEAVSRPVSDSAEIEDVLLVVSVSGAKCGGGSKAKLFEEP